MSANDKVYSYVTDRILKALDDGIVPWRKPWNTGTAGNGRHRNGVSGFAYRGINVWLTGCSGFSSPFWFTRKQISGQKGKIRKGEKGTMVTFWKFLDKKDKHGKPVTNGKGTVEKIPMFRYYLVWNLEQIDGVKPSPRAEKAAGIGETGTDVAESEFSPVETAEEIIKNSPVRPAVRHGGNVACYTPALDAIDMPEKESFRNPESYYATFFHEMGHATGHETRLARDLTGLFGDHSYTKEELIAEMTSAYLCGMSGIDTDDIMENSAAYINTWRRKISEDSRLVVSAASAAQKAADKVLGTEFAPAEDSE